MILAEWQRRQSVTVPQNVRPNDSAIWSDAVTRLV